MPAASSERDPQPHPPQETTGLLEKKAAWTAGGPGQVRGLERGCPFSQSRREIPVCPLHPPPPQRKPLSKATHPRGSPENPSPADSGPSPIPGTESRKGKLGLPEGRAGGGARPGLRTGGSPGSGVGGRLPGAGARESAGRTWGGCSSSRSSGNRSKRLLPAE